LWIGHLKLGRQRAEVQAIQFWIYEVKSPGPPVNLLALVLALVIHYHEKDVERKTKDCLRSMSQNRGSPPEKREEEQPSKHKQHPKPNFHQSTWK
jgi:hypothetical protein